MRILHIDPDDIDNPLSGGGPRRTYEIYRRLAARHEIVVLTPTFAGSTKEKVREGIRYLRLGRRIGDHGSSHHIFFCATPGRPVPRSRSPGGGLHTAAVGHVEPIVHAPA